MSTARPSAPRNVRWIVRSLEEAGHDAWAVGGAVRDVLMGRRPGDWDLATSARPREIRRVFRRTVPLGLEHGTVGILARDGTMYEVTTFRRDVETDGRHAVIAFAATVEEDLARRDFTINAVAWHPLREELLDPFGGVSDMASRVLRTVGSPTERFKEDYLRVLRALRFAGLFRFEIDAGTWAALCELVEELRALSAERVRDELLKVLDADPDPGRSLDLYARSGALSVLFPELEALRSLTPRGWTGGGALAPRDTPSAAVRPDPSAWTASVETIRELPRGRPMLRVAALVRALEPREAAAMLVRLRFSNASVDETAHRAGAAPLPGPEADERVFRRWLSASGPDRLAPLARLDLAEARARRRVGEQDEVEAVVASWRRAKRVRAQRPPLDVGALELDGRGLIQLGLRPGPHFGRILSSLLEWVLDDPTRNRREMLAERALELAAQESWRD